MKCYHRRTHLALTRRGGTGSGRKTNAPPRRLAGRNPLLALALGFLLLGRGAEAATYVNRDAQGNVRDVTLGSATWTVANSPYVLEAHVTVGTDATLTVEPGVTVQVNANRGLYVNGTLAASGATLTVNGAGNWRGIYLSTRSGNSVLSGCTIDRAGADSLGYYNSGHRQAAVYLDHCAATVSDCTISQSLGHGIELWPQGGILANNRFQDLAATKYAIAYDAIDTFPSVSGNRLTGGGIPGVYVARGTVTGTQRWNQPGAGLDYYLDREVNVADGARLIVDPGVTVRTTGGWLWVLGTLEALGTAAQPIVFTSSKADPAPGDWLGIYLGPNAGGSALSYATVAYAGRDNIGYIHSAYRKTSVYLDACSPVFNRFTVENSQYNGVEMYGSAAALTNLLVRACGGHALKAEAGSRPSVSDASFEGNGTIGTGYYTIGLDASSVPAPVETSFASNRLQGVQIWGGVVDADAVWHNWSANAPYVITADVTVKQDVSLAIEPGTAVKTQSAALYVQGKLTADGNPSSIVFTSWRDDTAGGDSNGDGDQSNPAPRDWKGIYLGGTSAGSLLNNCELRYGGGDNLGYIHSGYRLCTVYVDTAPATITGCTFANSGGHGLEIWASPSVVRNNKFQDIADNWYAMVYDTLSASVFPTMSGNSASGTGFPGIAVPGGTVSGTNTWNRPGTIFPYYLTGEFALAQDAQLNVDPGVTFLTAGQRVLFYGNLQALGAAAAPIVFSSRNNPPAPGDWFGVYLGPNAGDSRLSHVTIAYAGRDNLGYIHSSYRQTAMYVDSCSPSLDNLTIANSQYNGLELWACGSRISELVIQNCGRQALVALTQSWPIVDTADFFGNGASGEGAYTIAMDASSLPTPIHTTFSGNRMSGVQVIGGTLGASGAWKAWATNAPYVLTDNVTVGEGVTLDLEPGTVVKFRNTGLYVNGGIDANSVTGNIHFTSWRDDGPGGDSNGDGDASAPAPGDWKGIYLSPASGSPLFHQCVLRYAGRDNLGYIHSGYRYVTVYIDGCSPRFTYCTISDSLRHGLEFWSSSGTIDHCQFANFGAGGYAVVHDTTDNQIQASDNLASGTGIGGISLPGGSVAQSIVLTKPGDGFPYFLDNDLSVAEGATLTLAPGVVVKTAARRVNVYGTLLAQGTAAEPVVFTSRSDTPAPGDWFGLYFGSGAGASVLRYVNVEYAGKDSLAYVHATYRQTAIHVDSCSPRFEHLTVAASQNNGLELWASSAAISDLAIRDCGRYALVAESASWPSIQTARFSGNGANGTGFYTVGMDASSLPTPALVQFETNRAPGVQVWGGTLATSGTWKRWASNAPYVVTSDMTVGGAATLDVEPGTTVKFQTSGLYVSGVLNANGDPDRIVFTSFRDDSAAGDSNGDTTNSVAAPGDWKGIYLSSAAGDSVLRRCSVRFAGRDSLGYIHSAYRYSALFVDGCSPLIEGCEFADDRVHGIELWAASPWIRDNTFARLGDTAYSVRFSTLDCFPPMSGNVAEPGGIGGIEVPAGTISASGIWPRGGDDFPYILSGDVTLGGSQTLTLEPGVTVVSGGPGLYIAGTLRAVGTPSLPVLFSSRKTAPGRGDWKGVYLGAGAGDSILRFCSFEYAGADSLGYYSGGYRRTALYIDGSAPELTDLSVRETAGNGVIFANSSARLNNSLLYSNAASSVWVFLGGSPRIVNNTIVSGQASGIYCSAGTPFLANNIVAYHTTAGIVHEGGTPELRNNCVSGNVGMNYDRLPPGPGDTDSDPGFAAAGAANFRLADGSPAIGAGLASATEPDWMDLDGHLRLLNGQVDMGAYQRGTALALHTVDGLIRNAGETAYVGENTSSLDLQTKSQTTLAGQTATFQFRILFKGNLPDRLRVMGTVARSGWTVRYFDALTGGDDITDAATRSGGWVVTNATPGALFEGRVEMTADPSVPGNTVQEVLLTVLSLGDPTQFDTVRARTVNAPQPKPDLLVSRPSDIRFTGEDIYNLDGTGQTLSREVEAGSKAVFYLRASNRGNVGDDYAIHGTAGDANWSVRYFDSLLGANEITVPITGTGWTNLHLAQGASSEFRVEVTPLTKQAGEIAKEVLVRASSGIDATRVDTVRALTFVSATATTPQGRTYTTDADFDDHGNGILVGLEYNTVHDQLQLSRESVTLPFIWVPNSNEGTISKVNTRTGAELARYRTVPKGVNGDPSRTTVDQQGNCWIVNRRASTVVKFGLLENGRYNDRNGNGLIETSRDVNGDGEITGDELLPWGQDECVLFEVVLVTDHQGTFMPGEYNGPYNETAYPRAIAVDATGNVWAGAYNTKRLFYVSGQTGAILRQVDVASVNHTPYGAVIDAQGILWSAGSDKNHLLRLDPKDDSFEAIGIGHTVYGLGLDKHQHLFISGWQASKLSRLNVLTGVKDWTVEGISESRGVAVTDDGDVWVANSAPGTVARWSNDGLLKQQIAVGKTPTGVSVDADGKVWVVNNGDEYIHRIDPATTAIDLSKRIPGGLHYGYSDMTGIISRTATTRFGRWTVTHNAKVDDTPWGTVSWHALEPAGGTVKVRARSSNDRTTWSLWESAVNGSPLASVPPGKYLQVEATLQTESGEASPVLYDLTVNPSGTAIVGQLVYEGNFQNGAGQEWSTPQVDHAPMGGRPFLGQFGNTNVTLALPEVPPHSAVTVSYDLFVIGPWDGNETNQGLGLFTTDVGGGLKLLSTTFNNAAANGAANGQSYPQTYPASFPARTGAAETNTLGYAFDTVYRLSHTFPHTASPLVLNFGASGLAPDQKWGLANVRVHIVPTAVFRLFAGKLRPDGFHLTLQGEAQKTYLLQSSTNLIDWTQVGTIQLQSDSVEVIDSGATNAPRRIYRGTLLQ